MDASAVARWAGPVASLLSAIALSRLGKRDSGSPLAPVNAVGHWLWGDEAARHERLSGKYTVTGYVIHHASSIFWAVLFEAAFARLLARRRVGPTLAAAATTAVAGAMSTTALHRTASTPASSSASSGPRSPWSTRPSVSGWPLARWPCVMAAELRTFVLALLAHAASGGTDVILNNELIVQLPRQASAWVEQHLQVLREALFGAIFPGLARSEWHGGYGGVIVMLFAIELWVPTIDNNDEWTRARCRAPSACCTWPFSVTPASC